MRRALLRATAVFLALFGLLCLAFPVVLVAWSDAGPGLVDDTRAFFGRDLVLFWIFGAACLYATRVGWRKAAA